MKKAGPLFLLAKYAAITELSMLLVPVLFFGFDKWVSHGLYLFGYDNSVVSHLWFLRDQYEFIRANFPTAEIRLYDFHIFEALFWLLICLACFRIMTGVTVLAAFDARAVLEKTKHSAFLTFAAWLPFIIRKHA